MFSLYRKPELDNQIYDCANTNRNDVRQAEDVRASLMLVGDLNGQCTIRSGWFRNTNRQGISADLATVSDCNQWFRHDPCRW